MPAWRVEKRTSSKENSHPKIGRRNSQFRDDDLMAILGVPDIVVLEPVDVRIERAIRVEVHIGNEEACNKPSIPLSFEYSPDFILFGT